MPYGVDAVDQFQVVTSGGQAEFGRALGGYVNVVTKSGTNTLHGDVLRLLPRRQRFNAPNALLGHDAADASEPVRREPGRPDRARPDVLSSRTSKQRRLDQSGLVDDLRRERRAAINARLAAVGYPGSAVATGVYPNPVDSTKSLGKIDHQVSGAISSASATASTTSTSQQLARRGRAQRAERVGRPRQRRSTRCRVSNTLTLSSDDGERNARAVRVRQSAGAADGCDRSGGQHLRRRRRSARSRAARPARVNKMYEVVDNLSHQAGAHALRGGRGLPVQRRHDHVSALESRQLHVLVARELSEPAPTTTPASRRRSARPSSSQTNPERRRVRAGRMARGVAA